MFNRHPHQSQPWRTLATRVQAPMTSLLLAFGLTTIGLAPANGAKAPQHLKQVSSVDLVSQSANQPASQSAMADGVYLYGQSPERDQIGSAYAVFEVKDGEVIGAFYMPRSSFDCFHGNVEADRLALTIVDSYAQEAYPYSVALEATDSVATEANPAIAPVGLEGFHQIGNVSENDQRILSVCKQNQ